MLGARSARVAGTLEAVTGLRLSHRPVAVFLVLALGACAQGPRFLDVDLVTDLVPGVEFSQVDTVVTPRGSATGLTAHHDVVSGEDFLVGERIAEITGLQPSELDVVVRMRRSDGSVELTRSVVVDVVDSMVVTVVATRDCRGVTCPMAGDAPDATACLGSRCVPPQCFVESSASCGTPDCTTSADCAQTSTCARFECIDGTCLARPTPGACTVDQYCAVEHGCLPLEGSCVAMAACDTGNPCELGRLDCSTGVGVCRASGPVSAGEPCRAARDACDAPETCDGVSSVCPADRLAPAGTPCADGYCNGLGTCAPCTAGGACSTGNPCERGATDCSTGAPVCTAAGPAAAGTPCRPMAGACDVEEACDGTSMVCPTDAFEPATTMCRAGVGPCDVAEQCSGTSASCPPDALASSSTVCRPTVAPCDAPESCDGVSLTCPADAAPTSGCSTALRSAGTTMFTVPVGCTTLHVRAWGAAGGHGDANSVVGAGGYADGTFATTPGEVLTIVVGGPGGNATGSTTGTGGVPGGGRGGSGTGQVGGGGGGYSGVFRGAPSQATALVIAGGGGGSGGGSSAGTRVPGAGGGTSGEIGGGAAGTGGTQTAGGVAGRGGTAGTALTGGRGGGGLTDGGGGGGAGYFGGGGGQSASSDADGGGGGSGFLATGVTGTLTRGSGSVPGNSSSSARMGAGSAGSPGAVLLDCQ